MCGGSAAVILNVGDYPIKIYNDLDSDVVNFFEVLRDPINGKKLIELLELTPYSKEEFGRATKKEVGLSEIERARRFYILARQSIRGIVHDRKESNWKSSSRRDNMAVCWKNSINNLPEVIDRLREVHIENVSAIRCIQKYDSHKTLFYVDPPYVLSTVANKHYYKHIMTDEQHVELSDVLHNIEGRVVISGYRCALYDRIFGDWRRVDEPKLAGTRQETAWMNF